MKLLKNETEYGLRRITVGAKFSAGNKVRIKSNGFLGRIYDPQVSPYENMTGEIMECTNIVAFIVSSGAYPNNSDEHTTIYHYTVRIDEQITLHDVLEESLEIIS